MSKYYIWANDPVRWLQEIDGGVWFAALPGSGPGGQSNPESGKLKLTFDHFGVDIFIHSMWILYVIK